MAKEIVSNSETLKRLQSGVDRLANTVKITLGPKGRNVSVHSAGGAPLVTNDGATIAKEIELEDPVENLGAQIVKTAAAKTNEAVGDGTTTATLLAQSMIREGLRNLAAGANPVELKKGILGAARAAADSIRAMARPVATREAIARVAAISSGDEAIGALVAEAMERVGADGVISVDEGKAVVPTLSVVEGMQFDRGYLSPNMVTDPGKLVAELDHPLILITDRAITAPQELVPLLEQVIQEDSPLLIIADEVKDAVLGMLAVNQQQGVLKSVAVRAPGYGDGRRAQLEDLAILTGGTLLSDELGCPLEEATIDDLGSAASVKVSRDHTVIVDGDGEPEDVAERRATLRRLIEKTDYDFEKGRLKERLARLASGVAAISAGAPTEAEMKEKKLRIEDAVNAARAAVAEGVVAGGGTALADAVPAVRTYVETLRDDEKTGAAILLRALEEPVRQIASNAGQDGSVVIARVLNSPAGTGFDAVTGAYVDMMAAGIEDPVRVTRTALENAASVAATLLTTSASVTDIRPA